MTAVIVGLIVLAFVLGLRLGRACIIQRVRSGRLEASGRIYLCKDTGPVVK